MSRLVCQVAVLAMLAVSVTMQEDFRRPSKVTNICCNTVSGAPIKFDIYSYDRQNALGSCVEAIVFDTARGRFCSHPRVRWVVQKIKELDKKAKQEAMTAS